MVVVGPSQVSARHTNSSSIIYQWRCVLQNAPHYDSRITHFATIVAGTFGQMFGNIRFGQQFLVAPLYIIIDAGIDGADFFH